MSRPVELVEIELDVAEDAIEALTRAKNEAYWERDQLVAVLSKLWPSHLCRHVGEDWEDDWRNIVCIHTPNGQATWHIHDDELPDFAHLNRVVHDWDGHTTAEKYRRVADLDASKPDPKYGAVEAGLRYCWRYRLVVEQDTSAGGDLIDHYDPTDPCPGPHGIMWAAR